MTDEPLPPVTAAAIADAATRDPSGMAAVRERLLIGGALEYSPGWYLEWLCRPMMSARAAQLAIARQARVPICQGRPVWHRHTRKRWGQHG